jgi:hypothetical protein
VRKLYNSGDPCLARLHFGAESMDPHVREVFIESSSVTAGFPNQTGSAIKQTSLGPETPGRASTHGRPAVSTEAQHDRKMDWGRSCKIAIRERT